MKILFIQEFPLNSKGGGASIMKRLISYAAEYHFQSIVVYDKSTYSLNGDDAYPYLFYQTRYRGYRFGIGRLIGLLTILSVDKKAETQLKSIIREQNPDVIHIVAHGPSIPVISEVAKKLNIPYVISIHDLWKLTISSYLPGWISDQIFGKILHHSKRIFVISRNMGEYLKQRFNIISYTIIHDGVGRIPAALIKKKEDTKTKKILYAGILHGFQKEAMDQFLLALSNLPAMNFELHICSSADYVSLIDFSNIQVFNHGWLSEVELKTLSEACDFGFLPLSFKEEDALFYKTSLMTKIPLYIQLLLPIICFGPAYSSAVQTITIEDIGYVITDWDEIKIRSRLNVIFNASEEDMTKLMKSIARSAEKTFNIELISQRFYNEIRLSLE